MVSVFHELNAQSPISPREMKLVSIQEGEEETYKRKDSSGRRLSLPATTNSSFSENQIYQVGPQRRRSSVAFLHQQYVEKRREPEKVRVSIPGLGRLLNPQYGKMTKIPWFIVMIICFGVCLYLTANRLQLYFSYPTTVQSVSEAKKMITFPSFSICSNKIFKNMNAVLKEKVKSVCSSGHDKCMDMSLQELNINLTELIEKQRFKNVQILHPQVISQSEIDQESFTISFVDTVVGSCAVITHNEEIAYFSAATSMVVLITENTFDQPFDYVFIPHGKNIDQVFITDVLTHEFEYFSPTTQTSVRILDQQFHLVNTTRNECYDMDEERKRINECALKLLKSKVCRLPSLPQKFRECKSATDISKSLEEMHDMLTSFLRPVCSMRRLCNEKVYSVTMDFVIPGLSMGDVKEEKVKTNLSLRLADDLVHWTNESFIYLVPNLVTDLAAYWGFFLCFSALVFAEMVELFLKKLYRCLCS